MTVSTTDSEIEYDGNGTTTAFPVPFRFLTNTDLVVTSTTEDGASTTLVMGTDYSVVGAGAQDGGAVIATAAPADGITLAISRQLAPVQDTDLRNQGRFYAETHENVFDYLTMLIQQCIAGLTRALTRPVGKSYFDAESRIISNVADPVSDQDAATKGWAASYFQQFTGVINNTLGILYGSGSLYDYLKYGSPRLVESIEALRSVSSTQNTKANVLGYYGIGTKGGGYFYVDDSDTTSEDNGGTVIVAADGARWKLQHDNVTDLTQWGVVADGSDQRDRIQRAIDWTAALGGDTRGPRGKLTSPTHLNLIIDTALILDIPIQIEFLGWILYQGQTGAAVIIGSTALASGQSRYFYNLHFAGIQATTYGNTATPNTYVDSGNHGIEIRNMQFSRVRVDSLNTFTGYGIYFNCTNNVYSLQHVQDNDFEIGIIEYTGMGIMMKSVDAALGAAQVNRIKIQNMAACYQGMCIGTPDGTDYNSNDNVFDIIAIENVSRTDGVGIEIFGLFNKLNVMYSGSGFAFEGHADCNRLEVGNPGVTINDFTVAAQNNQFRCGHPGAGTMPVTLAMTFGQVQTNTYGVPIVVYMTISLTPTTSAAASAQLYVGKGPGSINAMNQIVSSAQTVPHAIQYPLIAVVQPGGAWQVNNTGGGTASIVSATVMSFGI
ncbi:phage tail fiber protein [Pseudomonas typographi]|uniref:Uncharacterized protein n=1 Tax=Pseudomonas typographi TaxID=2715964 RepID=A0ABR7Z998_9PSED|nr:phage tail fiber protein [Pseudomonas typographi]MBD1601995.1 hypothetical protein [Pseudomonas typographi]